MLVSLILADSQMMVMSTEYTGSLSEIKMRICMKVNGLITRKMAEVYRYIQTEPGSMAGGKMEWIMAMADWSILMEIFTSDIGKTIINMVKEKCCGPIQVYMKVISIIN